MAVMSEIFNERANLQRWLDIEKILAEVDAEMGIIPQDAAREISSKAKVDCLDLDYMKKQFALTDHAVVSTVRTLQKACSGKWGEYIHYGPTTQDIIDTGDQIAIKAAHRIIYELLREIEGNLLEIAEREMDTVMAGRTHGQHGLPVTMGFKVAVWVSEIRRHIERLKESRKRLFVGMLAGAVGTYASFGERGTEIESRVMEKLGLDPPDICWASARDRNAEFGCLIAMISGTMGKIASEIYTLQRTEVAEMEEPISEGTVGSSTMPQKRNPHTCEVIMGLCKRVKYCAMIQVEGMWVEHERGDAGWYVGRDALAEQCLLTGDILTLMKKVTKNPTIDRKRMRQNLDLTRGMILSEAVMFELGQKAGKQTAHELVYEATMKAAKETLTLKDALFANPNVAQYLSKQRLDEILDPAKYVGLAPQVTLEVIRQTKERRAKD